MQGSLKEFFSLLFHKGWQLIAILFGVIGIIGVVDSYTLKWIPTNLSIPTWVWFLVIIVSTIIACFLVFNRKNAEYHSLRNKLTKVSKIEETLSNLAQLREEGVTLRNDGMKLLDDDERAKWATKSDDWNKQVESAIKSLSEPEARIYHILDWVDFPIDNFLGFYSDNPKFMREGKLVLDAKTFQHIMNLRMHSQRLRGLKDFVLNYSKDAVLTKLDSTTENGKLNKQTMA